MLESESRCRGAWRASDRRPLKSEHRGRPGQKFRIVVRTSNGSYWTRMEFRRPDGVDMPRSVISSLGLRCSTVLPLLTVAPEISRDAVVMPLPLRLAVI